MKSAKLSVTSGHLLNQYHSLVLYRFALKFEEEIVHKMATKTPDPKDLEQS